MTDSPDPDAAPAARPGRRRWLWVLGGLLALLLVLRLLLAPASRWLLESQGARALGLPVAVQNVDWELLAGRLAVDGLVVAGAPVADVEPFLSWSRLALDFEWLALLRGEIELANLQLDGLSLALYQDDRDRLEIPVAPPAAATEAAAAEAADPASTAAEDPASEADAEDGWPILVGRLELNEATTRILDAGGGALLARLGIGRFGLDGLALRGREIGLAGLDLSDPSIALRTDRLPSGVSGPLFPEEMATEPASEPEPAGAATGYRVGALAIQRAAIAVTGPDGEALSLVARVGARDVDIREGRVFPLEVDLSVGSGELAIRGLAGLLPPRFEGTLRWSDLVLAELLRPVRTPYDPWLRSGRTSAELELQLQMAAADSGTETAPPLLSAAGSLRIEDLDFSVPEGDAPKVAWERLALEADRIVIPVGAAAPEVHLAAVTLEGPRIAWRQPPEALDALLAANGEQAGEEAAAPEPEAAAPSPEVTVAAIRVSDGEIVIEDRSVDPPFRDRLSDFQLSARDYRLAPRRLKDLQLEARSLGGGPLRVTGGMDEGDLDARLVLRREGLPAYDPYARSFAGYAIGRGAASVEIDLRQRGNRTRAETELTLHDLQLAPQGEDTFAKLFGVPVSVALALLRDPAGNIGLSIPVEMDDRGVQAGMLPILYDAFRQAMVGALASPLKTLGFIVKGDGDAGIAHIAEPIFAPGSAALNERAEQQGRRIAALLAKRPELRVEVQGATGARDGRALREQRLLALRRADEPWPEVEGSGFFSRRSIQRALEEREQGEAGVLGAGEAALLDRLCAAIQPTPAQKDALADARARALRALLVEQLGVSVAQVGLEPGRAERDAGVRLELGVRPSA